MSKGRKSRKEELEMWRGALTPAHITDRLDYDGYSMVQRWTRSCLFVFAGLAVLCLGSSGVVYAQAVKWDSMLSNSYWYVPQENLLAYMTSGTSFTDPTPMAGSDQTRWSLGTATNGFFSGTAVGTFRPLDFPLIAISNTDTITSGIVTEGGQIRMTFMGVSSGDRTIGIGQVRTISGTDYMEMQMITGGSSVLTTHWAYMAKYDPNTYVPPSLYPDGTLLSQEWTWTEGSTWRLQSDDLFGPSGSGTFTITNYRNGYFWGPGTGPSATAAATYTQIGSITPEGNVLFNILIGGTLTSLAGQITGTGLTSQMVLRSYDGSSFGPAGYATVVSVPEPSTYAMALAGIACGGFSMWQRRMRACRARANVISTRGGRVAMTGLLPSVLSRQPQSAPTTRLTRPPLPPSDREYTPARSTERHRPEAH